MSIKKDSQKWSKDAREKMKVMNDTITDEVSSKARRIAKELKHKRVEVADVEEAMRLFFKELMIIIENERSTSEVVH